MPRPRKTARPKRDVVLDAAWDVFLEHGYARATMDQIAAAAGVSKRTVYDHFENKERLFGAIVERRRDEMLEGLAGGMLDESDPEGALLDFATRHLAMSMSAPVLELYRVVVAEAPRLPEPARIMYALGLERLVESLAVYFRALMKRGAIRRGDSRAVAEAFLGLLAGMPTTLGLMRVRGRPSARRIRAQAELAVTVFLRGMTPKEPST